MRKRTLLLLVGPVLGFMTAVLFWPLARMVYRSFVDPRVGIDNYVRIFSADVYLNVIATTLQVSAVVTLICLLVGYPMAYTAATRGGRLRWVILAAVTLPFWTSLLVRSFAFMVLLGDSGVVASLLAGLGISDPPRLLYNRAGAIIGMVYVLLPFMVLTLYAVMSEIDGNLQRAARSLGAGPFRAFSLVYLPHSLSGITGGVLLVFTVAVGFYVTPALLGGRRETFIAQVIQNNIEIVAWGFAAALAVVLLVVTTVMLFTYDRVLGRESVFRPAGSRGR